MSEKRPDRGQRWLDLERFRSARTLGQGGCVIAGLLVAALAVRLLRPR